MAKKEHNPIEPRPESISDVGVALKGNPTLIVDPDLNRQRRHLTGTFARLSTDIHVTVPGIVGKVQYGKRGDRIQIMQYDPNVASAYGIRRVAYVGEDGVPVKGENFWRHRVNDDDLICEYSLALTSGLWVGTREDFNNAVKRGTFDASVLIVPPQVSGNL